GGKWGVVAALADAEMGRGVGQVQILTKSGTNQFRGSAVWNIQNSALDANTWNGNRVGTTPTWYNREQLTGSYGGPIIRNKTFFFAPFYGQRRYLRPNGGTPGFIPRAPQEPFLYFLPRGRGN